MNHWIRSTRVAFLAGMTITLAACSSIALPGSSVAPAAVGVGAGTGAAVAAAGTPGASSSGAPASAAQGGGPNGAGTRPAGTRQAGGARPNGGSGGSQGGGAARPGGAGGAGGGARTVPVEVSKAVTGTISDILSYAGTLQPKDSVKLSPLVNGQVVSVTVKVGDSLKAGDAVAQLDQTALQAQVDQAQANLRRQPAKARADADRLAPRGDRRGPGCRASCPGRHRLAGDAHQ